MKYFDHYRGRCPGRLIKFLDRYCGVKIGHESIFYPEGIFYMGRKIATYEWEPYSDVPVFTFYGDSARVFAENQDMYKEDVLRFDRPLPETRREFQKLAKEDPEAYRTVMSWDWMHPALIAMGAEAAAYAEHWRSARLDDLLQHESALVREGALLGAASHVGDWNKNFLIILPIQRMAESDPNPEVREVARELLPQCAKVK